VIFPEFFRIRFFSGAGKTQLAIESGVFGWNGRVAAGSFDYSEDGGAVAEKAFKASSVRSLNACC
jgi:hypothetical protein